MSDKGEGMSVNIKFIETQISVIFRLGLECFSITF